MRNPNITPSWSLGDINAVRTLGVAAFVISILVVISGSIYQAQMLVTGMTAPVPPALLKILLLIVFAGYALVCNRFKENAARRPALLFVVYLCVHALYSTLYLGIGARGLLQSYFAYYMPLLLVSLVFSINAELRERQISVILVAAFSCCAALGTAQFVSQVPIVPTETADGTFKVLVWNSGYRIRAFSFFGSPLEFGLFSSLVAAYSVAMWRKARTPLAAMGWIALLCIAAVCCYASATRAAFISAATSIVTAYIFTSHRSSYLRRMLPFVWLALGLLVAMIAAGRAASNPNTSGMDDASSFAARVYEMNYFLYEVRSADATRVLMGSGLVHDDETNDEAHSSLPIDNIYLAVLLHTGVIGLVLFFLLLWGIWKQFRRVGPNSAPLAISGAAVCSTLLCVGIFSTVVGTLGLMLCAFGTQLDHKIALQRELQDI